ncbi:hypothetical protein, partial [Nostoc sp. NZL]|nr:hypothetical protein [Nostoc sp. NZL]
MHWYSQADKRSQKKEKGCMSKKYQINLSESQREELLALVKKGSAKAREIRRAHTLLMAADGKTDEIIAEILH